MNNINFSVTGAFSDPYAAPPPAGYPTKDGAAGPEASGQVATESRGGKCWGCCGCCWDIFCCFCNSCSSSEE